MQLIFRRNCGHSLWRLKTRAGDKFSDRPMSSVSHKPRTLRAVKWISQHAELSVHGGDDDGSWWWWPSLPLPASVALPHFAHVISPAKGSPQHLPLINEMMCEVVYP